MDDAVGKKWFYIEDQKPIGPLSFIELTEALSRTASAREVLIWRAGFADWQRASEVSEVSSHILTPPPVPVVSPIQRAKAAEQQPGLSVSSLILSALFEKYWDFEGRASRKEFWIFFLFQTLVTWTFALLIPLSEIFGLIAIVVVVSFIFPFLAVSCRRLHDIDLTGWYQLLQVIPIIGSVVMIVMWCRPGTSGENRYGPDPLLGKPVIK